MTAQPLPAGRSRLKALGWLSVLLVAGAWIAVAAAFLFPDARAGSNLVSAGSVDSFAPGSVTYFEKQHFYLVRLDNGDFLAFYDLDPYQQVRASILPKPGDCRLAWLGAQELRDRGVAITPGLEGGAFREPCHLSMFTRDGRRVSGPTPAGLDGYEVTVTTQVSIDLGRPICAPLIDGSERSCQKVSRRP